MLCVICCMVYIVCGGDTNAGDNKLFLENGFIFANISKKDSFFLWFLLRHINIYAWLRSFLKFLC